MNQNLGPLAPEIALAASAVAGLLAGSWLPRYRQWIIRAVAAAACLAGLVAAGLTATHAGATDFGTSYAIDTATSTVRIVVLAATLLARTTCCCCSPATCSPPSPATPWPDSAKTPPAPRPP